MKSFKAFRLDTANHLLWRNGDRVPVAPKGFDVLAYLVEHAGQVVTQDELLEALWPETYVNPEVLRKYILEIRKTLGDRHKDPEFIETLPKRGYRFIAPVVDDSAAEPPDLSASDAAEDHATEEKVGHETAPSENPQATYVHLTLDKILVAEGKPQQALAEIEKEPSDWGKLTGQILTYHALGREQDSNAALAALIAKYPTLMAYQIAEVYAYRGESDKSFEWLDHAYKQRDPGLPEIISDPLFKNLRHDPRYAELLKKMRLPT
jgi:DNA-binding winged helix-turn-helix (wHTH) protein